MVGAACTRALCVEMSLCWDVLPPRSLTCCLWLRVGFIGCPVLPAVLAGNNWIFVKMEQRRWPRMTLLSHWPFLLWNPGLMKNNSSSRATPRMASPGPCGCYGSTVFFLKARTTFPAVMTDSGATALPSRGLSRRGWELTTHESQPLRGDLNSRGVCTWATEGAALSPVLPPFLYYGQFTLRWCSFPVVSEHKSGPGMLWVMTFSLKKLLPFWADIG